MRIISQEALLRWAIWLILRRYDAQVIFSDTNGNVTNKLLDQCDSTAGMGTIKLVCFLHMELGRVMPRPNGHRWNQTSVTSLMRGPVPTRVPRHRKSVAAGHMSGRLSDTPQSLLQPAHNHQPSSHDDGTNNGQPGPDTKDYGRGSAADTATGQFW